MEMRDRLQFRGILQCTRFCIFRGLRDCGFKGGSEGTPVVQTKRLNGNRGDLWLLKMIEVFNTSNSMERSRYTFRTMNSRITRYSHYTKIRMTEGKIGTIFVWHDTSIFTVLIENNAEHSYHICMNFKSRMTGRDLNKMELINLCILNSSI